MRKIVTIMAVAAMTLALFATSAVAGGHEWEEDDHGAHAHVMLVGVEQADDGTITFRNCVEFSVPDHAGAGNGALPTPAHHHSIHEGNAGGSPFEPGPLFQAGNWVIPLSPFAGLPFTGCESFSSPITLPF